MAKPVVEEKQVMDALRNVKDPDLGRDIVSLGFIKNMKIDGGDVGFDLELTTPACPVKERLKSECIQNIKKFRTSNNFCVNG